MENSVEIQFQLHPSPVPNGPGAPRPEPLPGGRLPRVTQVLALAIHFRDMVERGEVRDYAELARRGGVTRERLSQIMKLVWLAPDIQQEILYLPPTPAGRYPISESAIRALANILSWAEQRSGWNSLKAKRFPTP